ncbi:MAG: HU family DNA-binding protein [Gammaproteobacteria bacterium]|nr:HU family DNA-binding protein [Gammaproteobacteria bacterium]
MNTSELIKQLATQLAITQKEAHRLLHQELNAITEQLAEGKQVIIRGFGTFSLRPTRSRKASTQDTHTAGFKASQKFRDAVKTWRPE